MIEIKPFSYTGEITVPSSKSYLQRALAVAALSPDVTVLQNAVLSDDVSAAIEVVKSFGCTVDQMDGALVVKPKPSNQSKVEVFTGESGLSTRMFSPIAAAMFDEVVVMGKGSILERPMDMIADALDQLGATVTSQNGYLPLVINGPISGGYVAIDGSQTSQLLTGLLIALPVLKGDSKLEVSDLKSKPYIDMTLSILKDFNVTVQNENYQLFRIAGNQQPSCSNYVVEGDWSGAAFHVVGAAISGSVTLRGVNANSLQSDRAILDVVSSVGALVSITEDVIVVKKGALKPFEFDATDAPDLFPPLAALAAVCDGESKIHGVTRLKHKESDRGMVIQQELQKLGIAVVLDGDTMRIQGGAVRSGTVSSNNDHRIAMMGAILATVADGAIMIEDEWAIKKSYPGFYDDLSKMT